MPLASPVSVLLDLQPHREVTRLPRVRRLSYLRALLAAVERDGCTLREAREAVLQVVRVLDAAKAAALGRKVPRDAKGEQLVEQCVQMMTRLGLLERRGGLLLMTPAGMELAASSADKDRVALFRLLWRTFPHFRNVVIAVCGRSEGFVLPVHRYGGRFHREAQEQGLAIDQMSFEVVRDLASELLVLNWRPIFHDDGQYQHVYAAGAAHLTSLIPDGGLDGVSVSRGSLSTGTDYAAPIYAVGAYPAGVWTFIGNSVEIETFEQALWRHYLQLTDRVPRFPVLYPDLRDVVCEAWRIPDPHFDASVQELLRRPRRLEVYPAEGVLDYSSKTAITYKQVPPRTHAGQFMTFLKIDRKAQQDGS